MHNLDVLVVHEAAHDSDVGVALCGADPWSLRHLSPHTARPVFAPPRVMCRDVKCQQVTVLKGEKKLLLLGLYSLLMTYIHLFFMRKPKLDHG